MEIIIRAVTSKDAKRISYLIYKNTDANPNQYSKEQIIAWKSYNTPSKIKAQIENRMLFCAFRNNRLVGTIALKEDFVLGFYVSYSTQKHGIGTQLLTHLEEYAKAEQIKKLYLTATPSALAFYKKRGFKAKEMVNIKIYNVDFLETKMEKTL